MNAPVRMSPADAIASAEEGRFDFRILVELIRLAKIGARHLEQLPSPRPRDERRSGRTEVEP
jgi:hypothetical protein